MGVPLSFLDGLLQLIDGAVHLLQLGLHRLELALLRASIGIGILQGPAHQHQSDHEYLIVRRTSSWAQGVRVSHCILEELLHNGSRSCKAQSGSQVWGQSCAAVCM